MSSSSTNNTDPHIAVLAFPFGTHAAPLLTIIHRLATASPKTHFSFFNTSTSNAKIFPTSKHGGELLNVKACDVWNGVPEGYVHVGKPQEDIELFVKAAPESFRKGIKVAVAELGREVSCLVSDAFFWFAAEMAEEMGVPWVPFWTAGPHSLSAHVYTELIRETIGVGGIEGRENQTLKFIPGMSQIRVRDLPEGVVFGNLESVFSRMLHQMGQKLPLATAVFINSFEELDLTTTNHFKSKFNKFLNIGPFNLVSPQVSQPTSDTSGCLSWLEKRRTATVAYVSFGSVATPPPNELFALAEALEASGVPFIWSLRDNSKVHLPNGFLEKTKVNGLIVPWAPQLDILAHSAVGVFITHCGWNSLLESISGGVPMICRPFFGDQRLNGQLIEAVLEVGLKVEGGILTKNGQRTQFSNLQKGSFFLQSSTSPSHSTTQFRLHSLTPKEELSASPSNSEVHALKAKGKGRAYYLKNKKKEQRFSRQCLSSPETMEANGSSSNSNESQPSGGSNNSSTEKPNEKEIFVNHAEIAWHEKRREWVGDQSQRSRRMPREPIMSWTTTYEDLLLSTEPFQQPIPLAEMVDFLVDIWNEEGLYD